VLDLYRLYRYGRDKCRMGRLRAVGKAIYWGVL
jgi:hypothetical protein